jgi:hypothetical protein
MKAAFALLWLCAAVPAAIAQEAEEMPVALAIGNGAYTSNERLDNPVRDAAAATSLPEAG